MIISGKAGPVINNGGKIKIRKVKNLSTYIFIINKCIIDNIYYNDINYYGKIKK